MVFTPHNFKKNDIPPLAFLFHNSKMSKDQKVKIDKQKVTSNEQKVISIKQQAN